MRRIRHSEGIASESCVARGDDASGTMCSEKKFLSAILCCINWWPYNTDSKTLTLVKWIPPYANSRRTFEPSRMGKVLA